MTKAVDIVPEMLLDFVLGLTVIAGPIVRHKREKPVAAEASVQYPTLQQVL